MKRFKRAILMIIGSVLTFLCVPFTASAAGIDTAATGDGRIYLALGVFVVAIVVIVVLLLLSNKSKK